MKSGLICICLAAVFFLLPFPCQALDQADIAISDITINNECYWTIAVKNVGNTQLPATARDKYNGASLGISLNGAPVGGWRFGEGLQMPGSVQYFTLSGAYFNPKSQVNGTATIEARYNTQNTYTDTNMANNTLSKTFTCTPPQKATPDLAITSIDFTPDCRTRIKMANLGSGAVDTVVFQPLYLQRKMDNVPAGQLFISQVDPSGKLRSPQGSVEWIEGAEYKPKSTAGYTFATANNIVIPDTNYSNNSATVNVPERCKTAASSGAGQADIAISDITINKDCYWTIAAKNVGSTQLPATARDKYNGAVLSIKMNGASVGGWRFGEGLQMPGSVQYFTLSGAYFNPKSQVNGTATIEAQYGTNNTYTDTNMANNTLSRTFTCTPPQKATPDLAITSIDFTPDCRTRIKMANLGTGAVDTAVFQPLYLQRTMDGMAAGQLMISKVDPSGKLRSPQGTAEWIEGAEYKPKSTIGYAFATTNRIVIPDTNYSNNSGTVNLPERCKTPVNVGTVRPGTRTPSQTSVAGVQPKQQTAPVRPSSAPSGLTQTGRAAASTTGQVVAIQGKLITIKNAQGVSKTLELASPQGLRVGLQTGWCEEDCGFINISGKKYQVIRVVPARR